MVIYRQLSKHTQLMRFATVRFIVLESCITFVYENLLYLHIGREPESRMLPTPREFCRHILSERTTQAASNKRRLHLVSGGISL